MKPFWFLQSGLAYIAADGLYISHYFGLPILVSAIVIGVAIIGSALLWWWYSMPSMRPAKARRPWGRSPARAALGLLLFFQVLVLLVLLAAPDFVPMYQCLMLAGVALAVYRVASRIYRRWRGIPV